MAKPRIQEHMKDSIPKALSVHGKDAAQCPACLSFNFLRHLPQARWRRAQEGEHVIECVTCRKQYAAIFHEPQLRTA